MNSLTLTLNGNSSSLSANYFPPIELDRTSNYVCSLVDLQAYNSIPNITETNNTLHIRKVIKIKLEKGTYTKYSFNKKTSELLHASGVSTDGADEINLGIPKHDITEKLHLKDDQDYRGYVDLEYRLPVGSYELSDIIEIFKNKIPGILISVDRHTAKCSIEIKEPLISIDFTPENSIGKILGYESQTLRGKGNYTTEYPVNITDINTIRVDCNIASGSYMNGKPTHNIHEFYPNVAAGYKIVEVPKNLIYLPVVGHTIQTICVNITDQKGNLIDFRGETITCRIHIKKDQ